MQQFTQNHTKTIAIAAVSGSIMILLFGVVGAIAFRQPKAAQSLPMVAASSPQPSAEPSPQASTEPLPTQLGTDAHRRELRAQAQPLQPAPAATVPPETTPPVQVAATLPIAVVLPQHAANLRTAPSTQSIVKGVVSPGQQVQIKPGAISQNGVVWYPVIVGEDEGWIASGLLSRPQLPQQTRWYEPN